MVYTPNKSVASFDALKFEVKHAQDFEQAQKLEFFSRYEVDAETDCFGTLNRVWHGKTLIGTFYHSEGKWIADPFYQNYKYQGLDQSEEKICPSSDDAQAHIINCYEGN